MEAVGILKGSALFPFGSLMLYAMIRLQRDRALRGAAGAVEAKELTPTEVWGLLKKCALMSGVVAVLAVAVGIQNSVVIMGASSGLAAVSPLSMLLAKRVGSTRLGDAGLAWVGNGLVWLGEQILDFRGQSIHVQGGADDALLRVPQEPWINPEQGEARWLSFRPVGLALQPIGSFVPTEPTLQDIVRFLSDAQRTVFTEQYGGTGDIAVLCAMDAGMRPAVVALMGYPSVGVPRPSSANDPD